MISKLVEMVNEKIDEEKMLMVGITFGKNHVMNSFIPCSINVDDGVYIEGEESVLTIPEGYSINYNELEDEYIISNDNGVIYLS